MKNFIAILLTAIVLAALYDYFRESDLPGGKSMRTYLFLGSSHMSGRLHRFDFHSAKQEDFLPLTPVISAFGDAWENAVPPVNKYRLGPIDFISRCLKSSYPGEGIAVVCATQSGLDFEDFTEGKPDSFFHDAMGYWEKYASVEDWAVKRGAGFVAEVNDDLIDTGIGKWSGIVYCGSLGADLEVIKSRVLEIRKKLKTLDLPVVLIPSPGSEFGRYSELEKSVNRLRVIDVGFLGTRIVYDEEAKDYRIRNHHWNRDSVEVLGNWVADAFKSIEDDVGLMLGWSGWGAHKINSCSLSHEILSLHLDRKTGKLFVKGDNGKHTILKHAAPELFQSPMIEIDEDGSGIIPTNSTSIMLPDFAVKHFNLILSIQLDAFGNYFVLDEQGVHIVDAKTEEVSRSLIRSDGYSGMVLDNERNYLYLLKNYNEVVAFKYYWSYGDRLLKKDTRSEENSGSHITLEAEVIQTSEPLSLDRLEQYKEQLVCTEYKVLRVLDGVYSSDRVLVVQLVMRDREFIPRALVKVGDVRQLKLGLWSEDKSYQNRPLADDINDFDSEIYFVYESK